MEQCDQIRQLFQACFNNYFGHILGNFCKGVRLFHFSSGIILSNFYRHLAIFNGHTDFELENKNIVSPLKGTNFVKLLGTSLVAGFKRNSSVTRWLHRFFLSLAIYNNEDLTNAMIAQAYFFDKSVHTASFLPPLAANVSFILSFIPKWICRGRFIFILTNSRSRAQLLRLPLMLSTLFRTSSRCCKTYLEEI